MLRYIKTPTGRADDYVQVQLATTGKTMQVRADEGNVAGWIFARIVLPSGSETPFHFLLVNLHHGFPPERSPIDPYFVKAGVQITRAEWYEKLRETSNLVRQELWRERASVGRVGKDDYSRVDYLRLADGATEQWGEAAEDVANHLAATKIAAGTLTAWQAETIVVPAGTGYQYGARIVTAYPGWDEMGRQIDAGEPDRDVEKLSHMQDIVASELFNVIEVVYPSK
jgi:hypothetical protein